MRKKFLYILIVVMIIFGLGLPQTGHSAEDNSSDLVLKATVTKVPDAFYGTWRVNSKIIDTDSPVTFKQTSLDLWNLSRTNNVITLSNPFNGAKADITIDKVNNNYIVFKKTGRYGGKILTDTVEIKLNGDTFIGFDSLQLDTYSDINGKVIKTEMAKYSIKGEKIAGESVIEN